MSPKKTKQETQRKRKAKDRFGQKNASTTILGTGISIENAVFNETCEMESEIRLPETISLAPKATQVI